MLKILPKVLMFLVIFCFTIPRYTFSESSQIQVKVPTFQVTLNSTVINNLNSKYPLLVYKDITYFPMTYDYAKALGLKTEWNPDTGFGVSKNTRTSNSSVLQDLTGFNSTEIFYDAVIPSFKIKVNGKEIMNNLEEYPLFVFRDITYFPMTWRFAVTEFGFITSWSSSSGFAIKTNTQIMESNVKQPTPTNSANSSSSQNTNTYPSPSNVPSINKSSLLLYSYDGRTYLGKLTSNIYDSESIFNEYGIYGSKFALNSIFNEFGVYGSQFSYKSAFNNFASQPPIIISGGKVIGYLTTNTYMANAVSPYGLKSWLSYNGY